MRKIITLALALLLAHLAGCAGQFPWIKKEPAPAPAVSAADLAKLAPDAVKQLATIWLPAKTRLALQQPTTDEFGAALLAELRAAGYAVQGYVPAASGAGQAQDTESLAVQYVLGPVTPTIYRLTIAVGKQSITRPYQLKAGVLNPAGYWMVRQE